MKSRAGFSPSLITDEDPDQNVCNQTIESYHAQKKINIQKAIQLRESRMTKSDYYYKLDSLVKKIKNYQEKFSWDRRAPKRKMKLILNLSLKKSWSCENKIRFKKKRISKDQRNSIKNIVLAPVKKVSLRKVSWFNI
ncbi:unnamed protein product [Moneuplotes crassus]|uniref:Uncharacterized protein n=1 Tax=Euplotes crassus TaxID=5936 RepID=A0AAD1UDT9_EUPCR|nr:unnamed protein product [Moneuplotes crassus]